MEVKPKTSYSEKLLDPRWQKKRLEILQRDNFTCQLCGDTGTELHVHHFKYNGNTWETATDDLITYCKHCHAVVEFNKLHSNLPIIKIFKNVINEMCVLCAFHKENVVVTFYYYYEKANKLDECFFAVPMDLLINIYPSLLSFNIQNNGK